MTTDILKAVIEQAGGFDCVAGFRFANGYKVVYSNHVLKEEDFVTIRGMEFLMYHHKDTMGHTATSYLEVEEIVQVYVIDDITKPIILRDFME